MVIKPINIFRTVRKALFWIFLWVFPLFSISKDYEPTLEVKHIGVEAGLSQNQVNAIAKDHDGFLWVGTWDGLNRYDGYDFDVFKPIPFDSTSISGNFISSILVDSKGRTWIGTESQGLNLYLPGTESFYRIHSAPYLEDRGLSNNNINTIEEDSFGNIWIGTDFGLNRLEFRSIDSFSIETFFFHHFDERNRINQVNDLIFLNKEEILIACGEGLILFTPSEDKEFKFNRIIVQLRFPTTSFGEVSTIEIFDKKIIGGGPAGMFHFPIERIKKINSPRTTLGFSPLGNTAASFFSYKAIDFIQKDRHGTIWTGTVGNGLYKFNDFNSPVEEINLGASFTGQDVIGFKSFYHDPSSEVFWAGTSIDGLKKIVYASKPFENFSFKPGSKNQIANSSVFSIEEDDKQNIWIGTLKGFSVISKEGGIKNFREIQSASEFSELTQVFIYSIHQDRQGNLWFGTESGLFEIEKEGLVDLDPETMRDFTKKWPLTDDFNRSVSPWVYSLFQGPNDRIWAGTTEGLIIVDPEEMTSQDVGNSPFETKGLNAKEINSIFQDRSGQIWLSSDNGIHLVSITNQNQLEFTRISNDPDDQNSLCSDQVNYIYQDRIGRYWIATKLGLNKMVYENGKMVFTYYGKGDGLSNEFIYSILEDESGKLWMSTNKGIVEFDPGTETFRSFDQEDGVQGNEFNQGSFLKSSNKLLYFGGLGGMTRFDPRDIKLNTNLPKTLITSVYEGGEEVLNLFALKNQESLSLSYDQNDLQFSFVALEFKNPLKNQYSYMLEGLDEGWTQAFSKKTVDYPALKPGKYVFKVTSSNNDGVWNKEAASFEIEIIPPFWQRSIFYVIAAGILMISLYLIYRNRVRKKLQYLMTVEEIRQKENEAVRKKAAADFHDEMGHYLTRISVLTELLKGKIDPEKEDVSSLVERIGDQSRSLYQGTRDFIWTFDPKTNNFFEVMVRLKDFGDDLFQESKITFRSAELNSSHRSMKIPSDVCRQVVLLFKESMNNAAKHSKADNVVLDYLVNPDGKTWEISVEDDGVGLSESGKISGKGFESMKKRAAKSKLEFAVIERSPKGLKILLKNEFGISREEKKLA